MSEASTLEFQVSELGVRLMTDVPEVLRGLSAVWGSCRQGALAARHTHELSSMWQGERVAISLDRRPIDEARSASDALPQTDRVIYEALASAAADGRALLHAATLHGVEAGYLIIGASGAGKSSLSHAGIARGYLYGGDEIAVCDGARIWGIPRAVLYDPTFEGDPVPDWIEGADLASYRFLHAEGRPCALPLRSPASAQIRTEPRPTAQMHVVLSRRAERTALTSAEPLEVLDALYRDRWGDARIAAPDLVERGRVWKLDWRHPDEAWDALSRLSDPPVRPVR